MLRLVSASVLIVFGFLLAPQADAQRRGKAEIVQGMTTTELAEIIQSMRQQNADMNARLVELQSSNDQLNGKVQTLEFLLSETRDQINTMQDDDVKLNEALSKLRSQRSSDAKKIASLEQQVKEANSKLVSTSSTSSPSGTTTVTTTSADPANSSGPKQIVRRTVTRTTVTKSPTTEGETAETTSAVEENIEPVEVVETPLPEDPALLFAEAKSRLLRFDYSGAETAFRTFLDRHPEDPQAGEAHYWIAEALYQREEYSASGKAFTEMIRTFPEDQRAPEAIAKLARSLRLIDEPAKACRTLELLERNYPDASSLTQKMAATERELAECSA